MEKRYTYKPYSLRLKEYEYEKKKLIDQCLGCEDYEKAVQELAETLDIQEEKDELYAEGFGDVGS